MKNKSSLNKVLIIGLSIFILQIFFLYKAVYSKIWWLDTFMHILGGIWVAFIFFYWFYERQGVLKKEDGLFNGLVLSISFVALVGVIWEFHEYAMDTFFTTLHQQSLFDTMKDLLNDLLGGILASIYYLLKK